MKSRTSFFDKTVLKKDLTRFFPLWALYLIGGLLIMHILSGFYDSYFPNRAYAAARDLNALIGPMGLVNAGYAFLAAQLLFGDLHNTRLCYGVHALPLSREGWYLTHITSGVLMGLAPTLVIVITLLPVLGRFWFVGFLCWGALSLHYLFFFGLATFCMMATGNRFAATAIYGILNFLSLIVHWFAKTIYIPLLPGVRPTGDISNLLSPPVKVVQLDDFFQLVHLDNCFCRNTPDYFIYDGGVHDYGYQGLGGDWGYLLILAGVGIALLGLGLLLYRIRHLERAGDFLAFKPMKPIFLGVYSLCVGAVLFYLAYELADEAAGYFFLVIGLFIGYFTGRMLLERTVRVFNRKGFMGMGILYAAVALSLLLTWIDPIGISRRIPHSNRIDKIILCDGRLSDYQLNSNRIGYYDNIAIITDEEDIASFADVHRLLLQEHSSHNGNGYCPVTIQYHLKNGNRVSRTYNIPYNGAAYLQFVDHLCVPEYLFGAKDVLTLYEQTDRIDLGLLGEIPQELWPELLDALWKDTEDGKISLHWSGSRTPIIEISTKASYHQLFFSEDAANLTAWVKRYETSPQVLLKKNTLPQLIADTQHIYYHEQEQVIPSTLYKEFLTLLWEDCTTGKVSHAEKWSTGFHVEIQCKTGGLTRGFTLELVGDSQCAQWLSTHLGK